MHLDRALCLWGVQSLWAIVDPELVVIEFERKQRQPRAVRPPPGLIIDRIVGHTAGSGSDGRTLLGARASCPLW